MNTVYLFTEIIEKRIINTSWSKINGEVGVVVVVCVEGVDAEGAKFIILWDFKKYVIKFFNNLIAH